MLNVTLGETCEMPLFINVPLSKLHSYNSPTGQKSRFALHFTLICLVTKMHTAYIHPATSDY